MSRKQFGTTSRRLNNQTCSYISLELWKGGQSFFCCCHAVCMRPILSAPGTYYYPLAKWLDEKLKPLSTNKYCINDIMALSTRLKTLASNLIISLCPMIRQDKTTLFNQGSPISCKAGILRGPGLNKTTYTHLQ